MKGSNVEERKELGDSRFEGVKSFVFQELASALIAQFPGTPEEPKEEREGKGSPPGTTSFLPLSLPFLVLSFSFCEKRSKKGVERTCPELPIATSVPTCPTRAEAIQGGKVHFFTPPITHQRQKHLGKYGSGVCPRVPCGSCVRQ